MLIALQPFEVAITADQVGTAWNFTGESLLWVSPLAGLDGTATLVSLSGGTDTEELEDWRSRLLERKQLGFNRDRQADIRSAMHAIAGIKHIYVYPKRRGLGSLDVAITAEGNPPTLPSKALIDTAQNALDDYAGFWEDCRVFAPTVRTVNLIGINFKEVEQNIKSYFAELEPAQALQISTLISRVLTLNNVIDVTFSQTTNIVPEVNWMHVEWLRAGKITVRSA